MNNPAESTGGSLALSGAFLLALVLIASVFFFDRAGTNQFEFWGPLLILIVLIWFFDRHLALLRDIPPEADSRTASYSLGRTQMAFWTCLIVAALIYIIGNKISTCDSASCINFDILKLDTNILVLLGISGATGMVAMAVDIDKDKKKTEAEIAGEQAIAEEQRLLALIEEGRKSNSDLAAMTELERNLAEVRRTAQKSIEAMNLTKRDADPKGFLRDILEDSNGNSLHRLQMILFTLTTAAIFITQLVGSQGAAMPKVPSEILGLLGISNGLYVGFKIPGK